MKHSILPTCIYLLLLQLLQACVVPHYSLNKEEKAYIKNPGGYQSFSILYDNAAIRQLRDNGIYTVRFERRNLYFPDTMMLKVNAIGVAMEVSKFMNFKQHYKYIEIAFHGVSNGVQNSFGEAAESTCIIRMPLNNISKAIVRLQLNSSY